MSAIAPIPFDTEATVQGQQVLVFGVRPVSMKARLEVLAAHPMASDRLQKPCAIGLVLTAQLLAIFAGGLVVMTAASHQAGRRLFAYLP